MSFVLLALKSLAYASLPTWLVFRMAPGFSPVAGYYIRNAAYFLAMGALGIPCFISSLVYALIGRRYDVNNVVTYILYSTMSWLFNIYVVVEGEEHMKSLPGVLIMNHQSMLDLLVLGRLMPKQTSMVAKESLKYSPLGPFMIVSGSVFLDRKSNAKAVETMKAAEELMKKQKLSTFIFPEGTRHLSPKCEMLPFKKGVFYIAIGTSIPIIPIVVENQWNLYHKGVFGQGIIKVKVLPPVPTAGLTKEDIGGLAAGIREEMLQIVIEISSPSARPE